MAEPVKKTTRRKPQVKPEEAIGINLTNRSGGKKRGVMNSVSNTVIETADAVSETASALRRGMEISNIMLKEMKAEAIVDGYQTLIERGYTYQQAVDFMEQM